jgi:hypothetical protein
MITLFPDEKIILKSDNNQVILTSHRICYEYKEWSRAYNQSIMLEHITSCENFSIKKSILLVIAAVCFVSGLLCVSNEDEELFGLLTLIAIVFVFLFWLTRKNYIVIGSPSTKMSINVKRMSRENVLSFINNVEQTKHMRLLSINAKN